MQKKRHLLSTVIAVAAWGMAAEAPAIGWARAQQGAVLGATLDFSAALRLDPGDSVAPECVRAEVVVGEQRLPSFAVQLHLDSANSELLGMRVTTSNAIEEPVVAVTLAIGCPARLSRRFVLLADPPSLVAAAPAPAPVELPALRTAAAPAAVEEMPAAPARAQPAPAPPPPRPATTPRKPRRAAPVVVAAPSKPAEGGGARLRLDPADAAPPNGVSAAAAASAVEEAIQAVTQAASAARAAASAASAAEDRVAAIERQLAQLRSEADASRDQVRQLRGRLAMAESADRWVGPLLGAMAALAALVAWLGWRLRNVQQERQRSWRSAANVAAAERPATPTSQLPMVTSEIMAPPPPHPTRPAMGGATHAGAARPRPAPESAVERTQVLPPRGDSGAARDVTIEELLDLEQQAEFFIVLGQDDAAVDLLVDHLRDTGGGSPLPYLKLLEIYRRRNERDAYERTRTRFNHRFNAYAPDWDTDLQHGRSLDDYPGVIPRLQQVWARPLDAMAELEALLFRKSRGQLFDLPAYREVLFLYSLARDLLDREAVDNGHIDLLLPLADGGEFSATAPHPYLTTEGESVFDASAPETLPPTAPIDLDLSQPDEPSAIVRPLSPRR